MATPEPFRRNSRAQTREAREARASSFVTGAGRSGSRSRLWRAPQAICERNGTCFLATPEVTLTMRAVAFVVMESGNDWPSCVTRNHFEGVVVRQPRNQPNAALIRRTRELVARVRSPISLGVLACNGETDEEATERRVTIARLLLAQVLRTQRGRLILSTSTRAPSALRCDLIGLTATLSEALSGSSASVSLRFDDEVGRRVRVRGSKSADYPLTTLGM
jgi:hypothetical protein